VEVIEKNGERGKREKGETVKREKRCWKERRYLVLLRHRPSV